MAWIPFIYFCLLGYYLYWKAERKVNMALVLCGFFIISSLMSILIDANDLYGSYGINEKELSIWPTILYCVGLTFILTPFSKLSISSDGFQLRNPRLFDFVCYFICACIFIYIITYYKEIAHALVTEADEVKAEHYSTMGDILERGSQAWWMYLPNIFSSAWCLVLLCWFISITFLHKHILFNTMLLASSFVGVLKGSLIAGRSAIIYWIFCFIAFLVFFQNCMNQAQRRKIIISSLIPIILIVIAFVTITVDRFASRSVENSTDSLIGYSGQMYVNFCSIYTNAEDLPFTIERIAPLANRYLLGQDFNLLEYYTFLESETGVYVNVFYTLLGGLYLTIGGVGMFIYVIIFYLLAKYICNKISQTNDFAYITLLSIIVLVPIKGMFDVPFPSTSDSLVIIFTILIFFVFKKSFIIKPKKKLND